MKETIIKYVFAPIKARYRLLLILPVLNLLLLAVTLLFLKSPKEAILISMAAISFVIFMVGSKRFVFLFYVSSLVFNVMIFLITWKSETFWSRGWSLSMMVTLTLGYFLSKEVLDFYHKDEKVSKENDREKGLWKNRFETLRDSHNLEIVRLEDDLAKSKEGLKEKGSQIMALEKLVEVTHKEAAILSKEKHELLDKVRYQNDIRKDEEVKKQNIALEKELDSLRNIERDLNALKEEKESFVQKISTLQEENALLEAGDKTELVEKLQAEIEAQKKPASGYSKQQILKLIANLEILKENESVSTALMEELKNYFQENDKPFKWQVWRGEKKPKKDDKKAKISMNDLGKGLKI
ncbi:MAG: hypothetical protein S4CHLAM20_03030 [Chlamydiia bacterium]|nr:hypothetical protein [Chlamydiia bacterium]